MLNNLFSCLTIRLITEVKDWCSKLREMVNDSGKKLVEEVKSSTNPAGLKFVKNEDISSSLNQAKVGFLTAVSDATVQFKKKESTTIKEIEVSFCLSVCVTIYNLICTISAVWKISQLDSRVCRDRQVERGQVKICSIRSSSDSCLAVSGTTPR